MQAAALNEIRAIGLKEGAPLLFARALRREQSSLERGVRRILRLALQRELGTKKSQPAN